MHCDFESTDWMHTTKWNAYEAESIPQECLKWKICRFFLLKNLEFKSTLYLKDRFKMRKNSLLAKILNASTLHAFFECYDVCPIVLTSDYQITV